ncbi:MAG: GMC family oxidoreductase, partial [Candidatus Omnitrophica bacterium]|nr:GMC family oxidoreductase [Candidatus Omnitrophota bacterium]
MNKKYNENSCDVLIVGSGPGGVTSALELTRAGRDVLMLEEGRLWPRDQPQSYSLEEQQYKYRNVGLTPALGKIKVPYIEACCVGGASEINAGLYHYPI